MRVDNLMENLEALPEDWTRVNLREVVSKLVDGSHNPPPKKISGRPMLSARNIDKNQILFDDFRYIAVDDFEREHARTRIAAGDVLLTIVGTIGRTAVVPSGLEGITLQRSVAVLTPKGVLSKYLMYQLEAPFTQKYFEENARGTAQKGVYLKTLGQTPIIVAPLRALFGRTEISMKPDEQNNILLYQAEDGKTSIDVQLDHETVWLNLNQMAELFQRDKSVVSRHLRAIYQSDELNREATVAKNATVQTEGERQVTRTIELYNLDVIIAIGYRVNSRRGTQFRQWATRVLRDHLVKGYTIHEQRLREEAAKFRELQQTIDLLARTLTTQELVTETGKDVLRVINDYAYALATLDRYDHGTLSVDGTTAKTLRSIDYNEGIALVQAMKGEFNGLFGIEKDQGFKSALGTIYQTFDGKELYPSVEEKAANLLYFVVKNHAFSDGNKRIAAALFIYFLAGNAILYRPDGSKRLADNALVALTLLIAESRPEEKETIVKVIVNLINRSND